MKRKDCYFGLHFDYHANKDTKNIGKDFDEKILEKIVSEVKPDFIQCDTKGHPGYSSYYTKVGTPAPNLTCDLLKKWREVTKKYNVALFSHYSGCWDKKYTSDFPEESQFSIDGNPTSVCSTLGKYVDEILIPQLIELAKDYDIDGAWVDGECWAIGYDFSIKAKEEFKKRTGLELNEGTFKNNRKLCSDFIRQTFFEYVKHYISKIKKVVPNFEITSNWLNTAWVPDNLKYTDYISGDLSPINSVDSARFDGRIMQAFGRNWDIMSWGISFPIHYAKSSVQLEQEASIIMALGGGFQVYNMQSPNKVVMDEWAIPIWAKLSKFCKERKEFCHNGVIVKDLGVVLSTKAYYDSLDGIFNRDCDYFKEMYGNMLALSDNGRVVSIVNGERLNEVSIDDYKTLFVSNSVSLEEGLIKALLKYAINGGELVLSGTDTIRVFAKEIGLEINDKNISPVSMINGKNYAIEVRKPYIKLKGDFKTLVKMHECIVDGDIKCENPPPSITAKKQSIPAFVSVNYGKGKIYLMTVNIGKLYLDDRTFELSSFYNECLSRLNKGIIMTNKNGQVEVLLTKKNNKTYLHLINLLGEHRSQTIKTFNSIPPLTDVKVEMQLKSKPKQVKLQPENKAIKYAYKDGKLKVGLRKVDIYSIIEIE